MKKNILLVTLLLQCSIIFAQLVENSPCTATCLDPSKTLISGRMPKQDGLSPNNNLPCGAGTTEDNPTWWVFRPSGTTVTFNLKATNCTPGTCGSAVSLDLWEGDNCANIKNIKCNVGLEFPLTATVSPCKTYFLQLDGLCEAQCYVLITYDPKMILYKAEVPKIQGATQICKGKTSYFSASLPSLGCAPTSWKWTIDPISAGVIKPIAGTNEAQFKFTGAVPTSNTVKVFAEPIFTGKCPPTTQKSVIDLEVLNCNCTAFAGEMQGKPTIIASKIQKTVSVSNKVGTEKIGAEDTYAYVLHEGKGSQIINPIATNQTGIFSFDASKMKCNKIYFVSYVVGKKLNGLPDPNDDCFTTVPKGQPVSWLCPIKTVAFAREDENTQLENTVNNIVIYPNPTNDKFNVEFIASGNASLFLYDIQGKLLLSQKDMTRFDNSHYEVPVDNFPKGIYLLKIFDEKGMLGVKKIMKE